MRQNQQQWLPGFSTPEGWKRSDVTEQVVEICAGAGGQALGLEQAGFRHALAIELDDWPVATLRHNRPSWDVRQGDVADRDVWDPSNFEGVDLLAGGVPCPPFSVAGKQLGTADERDLFAWAVELTDVVRPKALMLENVRGLSMPRFSAYRQAVLDRLTELGYIADWKLLHAANHGVPQLRPRFVLVALQPEYAPHFVWPDESDQRVTVGQALLPLMSQGGWPYAEEWAAQADVIAPTIVGGSKKHGGADLGPTRARQAWQALNVDGRSLADSPPTADTPHFTIQMPRLTVEMTARLQGWTDDDNWVFSGRKTAQYRQIGNAFPPPLAKAIGSSIRQALRQETPPLRVASHSPRTQIHDPVYRLLRDAQEHLTHRQLIDGVGKSLTANQIAQSLENLQADFDLDVTTIDGQDAYKLQTFRAFVGQGNHSRHRVFDDPALRSRVS